MKERKISTDILSAVFSVFLSTALIVLTLVLSLYLALSSFTQGNAFGAVAENIGSEAIKSEMPAIAKSIEKYGFKGEKFDEFLGSDAIKEIGKLYGKDLSAALQGDTKSEAQFTASNIKGAMIINLDELVNIAVDKDTTDEKALELERKIVKTIKSSKCNVIKTLSTKKELAKEISNSGFEGVLQVISDPSIKTALWIIVIALCVGVFALRYYKLGGLVWLGTDFIFVAVILLVLIILSISGVFSMLLGQDTVTKSVIWVFTVRLIIALVVTVLMAVGFYTSYGILKKKYLK